MRYFTILPALAAAMAGLGASMTVERRASPGYPSPNQQQLRAIEVQANGKLSNAPPPAKLAPSSLTALQLIAFNEEFEVAFFSSLLKNITDGVDGYKTEDKDAIAKIIRTILAQEELHAIDAVSTLKHFKAFAPSPCKYTFPVTSLKEAISLAETFTTVVLGTLQDANQLFAKNGDIGPVREVSSVIGQEGEQTGFFRLFLDLIPSEKPFLTTSVAPYAFSALQQFVVKGSCPFKLSQINLPIFPPLKVISGMGGGDVKPQDQMLEFSVDINSVVGKARELFQRGGGRGLYVTYLTGQDLPVSEPVKDVRRKGNTVTFKAFFPYKAHVMDGLSIAGLTTKKDFAAADDLPAATVAAPGLIQVNRRL